MNDPDKPAKIPAWITNHLRRYQQSNGADGHLWDAAEGGGQGTVPTLLLTTTGRRTGRSLTLPLIYREVDGACVVIASKGGAPAHPAWFLNLQAQPEVEVQVGARKFRARSRVAKGAERARLWNLMVDVFAPYTDYQQRTDREIPVVVLQPNP